MKLPRVRFTVRRMMVAMAVLCVGLGVEGLRRRRAEYFSRWRYHSQEVPFDAARFRYHSEMAKKYALAARYPWLLVEPDPPEPK